jgi:hypothetical protein
MSCATIAAMPDGTTAFFNLCLWPNRGLCCEGSYWMVTCKANGPNRANILLLTQPERCFTKSPIHGRTWTLSRKCTRQPNTNQRRTVQSANHRSRIDLSSLLSCEIPRVALTFRRCLWFLEARLWDRLLIEQPKLLSPGWTHCRDERRWHVVRFLEVQ